MTNFKMLNMDIAAIRTEYTLKSLRVDEIEDSPLKQFDIWLKQAIKAKVNEPSAMSLATVNLQNRPTSRILLLKGLDHGFVFYTSYKSQKGKELDGNPFAAMTFFWPELERQVRVEGKIVKTSVIDSEKYFLSRPMGSQIGAWASPQSEIIPNREFLEQKEKEMIERFKHEPLKKPESWGGYRLIPDRVEFWQGRPNRLHDRILFLLSSPENWKKVRLAP